MTTARAPRPRARSAPARPSGSPAWGPWAVPLAAALVAALVWSGGLGYFFAQDDFAGLARASGALPRLVPPWRWLSGQLYFDVMRALAGLDPAPYRAVSLCVHVANAALLAWLLARRRSAAAALLGGVTFAAHPAAFTAVYSISGIGELLATGFALLAWAAYDSARARWLAPLAFAASLLGKETTLLLPLVLLLAPGGAGDTRGRRGAWIAMVAVAAAHAAVLVAANSFGVRGGPAANAAYAAGIGPHLGANLLTYAGWSADVVAPLVSSFTDAVDRRVWPAGAVLLVAMAASCAWRPARERGAPFAVAWWLAAIAFVLPLRHHTYHYYLTIALAGLGAWVALVFDAAVAARVPAPRAALAAVALAALLAWSGAGIVRRVESHPFLDPRMRSDPTVDRARIAARVREGVARAELAPGTPLAFWSPRAVQPRLTPTQAADTTRDTYWERNVQAALLDGLALRVLFPELGPVRFTRTWAPDSTTHWAVYGCDGLTNVVSDARLAAMLRTQPAMR